MGSKRMTWALGGAGLIFCGVIALLGTFPHVFPSGVASVVVDIVYAASVIFLAVGLSREASVVGRNLIGVVALMVLGLWPLAAAALGLLLPFEALLGTPVLVAFGWASLLVPLCAALVGALQIARSNTVPSPWRWAPLAALGVVVVLTVIPQALMLAVGADDVQRLADLFVAFAAMAYLVETVGLGVLAVTLAARLHLAVRVQHSVGA